MMQTWQTISPFPMQDLDQIEAALSAVRQWEATLLAWRQPLIEELERQTRPEPAKVSPLTRPARLGPGFEYQGEMNAHWSYIDIHTGLLRRLWSDYPERRETMASAMAAHGTVRSYVARSPEELFPGKERLWATKHSRLLIDGWFVDANMSHERMRSVLPAAVRAAGLQWGMDVKVYWRATPVSH